jgi:hypothetical protein
MTKAPSPARRDRAIVRLCGMFTSSDEEPEGGKRIAHDCKGCYNEGDCVMLISSRGVLTPEIHDASHSQTSEHEGRSDEEGRVVETEIDRVQHSSQAAETDANALVDHHPSWRHTPAASAFFRGADRPRHKRAEKRTSPQQWNDQNVSFLPGPRQTSHRTKGTR